MKKLIASFFVFFGLLSVIRAEGNGGTLGTYGNQKIWRTTTTASNDFNLFVASCIARGGIVIGGISVGVPGTSSTLELWDGSVSSQTATKRLHKVDTTSKVNPNDFAIYHTSGIIYNNLGTPPAEVTIFWDWLDTNSAPNK